MPIILGLPFLEKNKNICDHESCSCITKGSNYNLLYLEGRKPHPITKSCLREQIKTTKKYKKNMLCELVDVNNKVDAKEGP